MKNILKKIGVIGIIIAMLAPFVEMPVAKAAESKTCTDHTVMQYYFLDVADSTFAGYEDGYKTYALFKYLFPEESGKEVNILNTQLLSFSSNTSAKNSITTGGYYGDLVRLYNNKDNVLNGSDETIRGNYETKYNGDYKVVKVLHGKWAKKDENSTPSTWNNIPPEGTEFEKVVVQNLVDANVTINSAQYSGSRFSDYSYTGTDLKKFFTELTSSDNSNFIYKDGNEKYFALGILRKFSDSDISALDTKTFGQKCVSGNAYCSDITEGSYYAFSESASSVSKSYSAYKKALNDPDASEEGTDYHTVEVSSNDIDVDTGKSYYWPAVLTVEYEVCTNTSEKWTLKYDGNTDDNSATNLPQPDTIKNIPVGTGREVDAKTPSRSGYTFKGWNTEKDGTGTWYKAGQEVKSDVADVITLFAQWGDTSKGEQKSTGVASYIIGFISVGIVAGGIYLIAKKKNLFKQI